MARSGKEQREADEAEAERILNAANDRKMEAEIIRAEGGKIK